MSEIQCYLVFYGQEKQELIELLDFFKFKTGNDTNSQEY